MRGKFKREPDFTQFLKVLRREGKPKYLPFYEHIASPEFIAARTETPFEKMTDTEINSHYAEKRLESILAAV